MFRTAVALLVVMTSGAALAQPADPSVQPKVIVVPYPGEAKDAFDAGVSAPTPDLTQPAPTSADVPPAPPPAEPLPERTLEAVPPPPPPADQALNPEAIPQPLQGPGAFLDGHPREGAFLSGPGSLTFILHHTLMTGFGVLATQMVPRINDAYCMGNPPGCVQKPELWTSGDARVAYLAGTLIGAGVGFGASAFWQFTHWMNHTTATFGIVNSFFGGAFAGAMTDLLTNHTSPTAISWVTLLGSLAGAWLTAVIGGGDLALNKGVLISSGGGWAMIYTALILAVVATTGGGGNLRAGIDALMITPAIGAAALAFATLKFNPSTMQIMRANLFGLGAGGVVLLLSALVLGVNFASPVPYILAGVAAIGAKVTVSLLWAEAAESPQPLPPNAFVPMSESEKRARAVLYW